MAKYLDIIFMLSIFVTGGFTLNLLRGAILRRSKTPRTKRSRVNLEISFLITIYLALLVVINLYFIRLI